MGACPDRESAFCAPAAPWGRPWPRNGSPVSTTLLVLAALALGGPADLIDSTPPGEVRPGFAPLGSVLFHPEREEIEVRGWFNLRGGFIEFLACLPGIKPHETLVALDCDPADLQAALILLGVEPGRRPATEADLGPLEGDRLIVRLRYSVETKDGTIVRDIRAEDVTINGPMEREMARVGFVFTGSTFVEDLDAEPDEDGNRPEVFAPRVIGQIIALSHRPYAMLDNPLALPYRDGDYYAYPDALPRLSEDAPTPVALVIRRPRPGEIDTTVTRMALPGLEETGGVEPADERPEGGRR